MNFSPDSIALILEKKKTQTRRPVKHKEACLVLDDTHGPYFAGEKIPEGQIDAVIIVDPYGSVRRKWEVGKTYAACPGRGERTACRIRIADIRRERVCDISEADARAEGMRPQGEIWRYGPGTTGFSCSTAAKAYQVLWRSLYPRAQPDCSELCWALTFKLVGEEE